MTSRALSDLDKNYDKHFKAVATMDSDDQMRSLPEYDLVFFLLLNYLNGLNKRDFHYWKEDFGPEKFYFKTEWLRKILNYLSQIDEPLAMVLFELIGATDHSARWAKEFSLEDKHYFPFVCRCQVYDYLLDRFVRTQGEDLQDYLYRHWPQEPTLLSLDPDVRTRELREPSTQSGGPLFPELIFDDRDCDNVGLLSLTDAFLAKLWLHGASDETIKSFLDESEAVEKYQFFKFFNKYGRVELSDSRLQHYEALIAERLAALEYFPKENYAPSLLIIGAGGGEKFLKFSEIVGIHVVAIEQKASSDLISQLRSAIRMAPDILLFQNDFELNPDSIDFLRNAYLSGQSLAFLDVYTEQITKIKDSLIVLKQKPRVFKLPVKS